MSEIKIAPERKLTDRDLRRVFWRSCMLDSSWNYERQQNIGYSFGIVPVIEKVYEPGSEKQKRAYARSLDFMAITPQLSTLLMGIDAAMEEENANNEEFDTSSISSMKVALMGPLAGIGDSLIGGTLRIIATGIAGGLCMAGSPFGPLLFLLIFNAVNIALRCLGVKYGYGLGENIISKVSDPSTMQKLTCALSIVGLMVIGGMIATNVAITTPIAFDISGTAFSLQDTLDSIFPKLLPVAAFGILYALNKKGVNVLAQIIAIMVLGVALGAVGILG